MATGPALRGDEIKKSVIYILLTLLTLPALAGGLPEKARKAYDFDDWPGKNGALKQGARLAEVDFSPLAVKSVRDRLASSGLTILRYGPDNVERHVFEVAIGVFDTVVEGQEALLHYLGTCTTNLPSGSDSGVTVGDVTFVGKEDDCIRTIAFTRNNVFIRISLLPSPADTEEVALCDVESIAAKIDEAIRAAEEAATAQDLKKPLISEFSAASAQAAPGEEVEITLSVSDPRGDELAIRFDEGGGMVYEKEGSRFFTAEKPGTYTVTVYVINEHFQASQKSITITVN